MINSILPLYPSCGKIVERSLGCYQYDSGGKEYVDFESGVWCVNLGHSHPKIVKVLEAQSKISIHHGYRFRNSLSELLSAELQQLVSYDNGASVFLSSGSEAINLSVTIAQKLTGRPKILKISNSYLSAFGFGMINSNNQTLINIPFNDLEAVERQDFSDISALVLETGGASVDMVRFPDEEFVKSLVQRAINNNCLIIADEVTTGLGRLGTWFGFEHYQVKPDMVVCGKALGNGYPVSSVTLNSNCSDLFNKNIFRYAQSHQNDPLGCAVALAVLKVFNEEQVLENCKIMGNYFLNRLHDIQSKYPDKIKEVRARGLMLAVEFHELFNGEIFQQKLFERGFVFGFKLNTLRFLPPLVIGEKEIDSLGNSIVEILEE